MGKHFGTTLENRSVAEFSLGEALGIPGDGGRNRVAVRWRERGGWTGRPKVALTRCAGSATLGWKPEGRRPSNAATMDLVNGLGSTSGYLGGNGGGDDGSLPAKAALESGLLRRVHAEVLNGGFRRRGKPNLYQIRPFEPSFIREQTDFRLARRISTFPQHHPQQYNIHCGAAGKRRNASSQAQGACVMQPRVRRTLGLERGGRVHQGRTPTGFRPSRYDGRNRVAVRRREGGDWIGRPKVALAPLGNLGLEGKAVGLQSKLNAKHFEEKN